MAREHPRRLSMLARNHANANCWLRVKSHPRIENREAGRRKARYGSLKTADAGQAGG